MFTHLLLHTLQLKTFLLVLVLQLLVLILQLLVLIIQLLVLILQLLVLILQLLVLILQFPQGLPQLLVCILHIFVCLQHLALFSGISLTLVSGAAWCGLQFQSIHVSTCLQLLLYQCHLLFFQLIFQLVDGLPGCYFVLEEFSPGLGELFLVVVYLLLHLFVFGLVLLQTLLQVLFVLLQTLDLTARFTQLQTHLIQLFLILSVLFLTHLQLLVHELYLVLVLLSYLFLEIGLSGLVILYLLLKLSLPVFHLVNQNLLVFEQQSHLLSASTHFFSVSIHKLSALMHLLAVLMHLLAVSMLLLSILLSSGCPFQLLLEFFQVVFAIGQLLPHLFVLLLFLPHQPTSMPLFFIYLLFQCFLLHGLLLDESQFVSQFIDLSAQSIVLLSHICQQLPVVFLLLKRHIVFVMQVIELFLQLCVLVHDLFESLLVVDGVLDLLVLDLVAPGLQLVHVVLGLKCRLSNAVAVLKRPLHGVIQPDGSGVGGLLGSPAVSFLEIGQSQHVSYQIYAQTTIDEYIDGLQYMYQVYQQMDARKGKNKSKVFNNNNSIQSNNNSRTLCSSYGQTMTQSSSFVFDQVYGNQHHKHKYALNPHYTYYNALLDIKNKISNNLLQGVFGDKHTVGSRAVRSPQKVPQHPLCRVQKMNSRMYKVIKRGAQRQATYQLPIKQLSFYISSHQQQQSKTSLKPQIHEFIKEYKNNKSGNTKVVIDNYLRKSRIGSVDSKQRKTQSLIRT